MFQPREMTKNYSITMGGAHYGVAAHANQTGLASTFGMACGNDQYDNYIITLVCSQSYRP